MNQSTIEQIERLRPTFEESELRLGLNSNSLRVVPMEFVPHTATMFLISETENSILFDEQKCQIVFEYSINEFKGKPQFLDFGTSLIPGKYTNKVLEIFIDVRSYDHLIVKLETVAEKLLDKVDSLSKDSHVRHFEIIKKIILDLSNELERDSQARNLFYA